MGKFSALAIIAWLAAAPAASAEVLVTYVTDGQSWFSFAVPDEWRVRTGTEPAEEDVAEDAYPKPRIVSAMPDDNMDLWLGLWVPAGPRNLDEAAEYLTSLRGVLLDDPVVASRRDDVVNDMAARFVEGIGTKDGEPKEFVIGLFQIMDDAVAVVTFIGRPQARAEHTDELQMIVNSLTPAGS